MWAVVAVEAMVIALLAVLVVGLLRSHAEILRRLHDLGAGAYEDGTVEGGAATVDPRAGTPFKPIDGVPAPRGTETPAADIGGDTPHGDVAAVGVCGVAHTTLLAFLSTGCTTCHTFWEALAGDLGTLPGTDTRIVIITKGSEAESPNEVAGMAPSGLTTLMSTDAWDDYDVPLSPYFILVDGPSSSVVGEGAAASWEQVRGLLEQACADIGLTSSGAPVSTQLSGDQREARADAELRAAGISPGGTELYHDTVRQDGPSAPDGPT